MIRNEPPSVLRSLKISCLSHMCANGVLVAYLAVWMKKFGGVKEGQIGLISSAAVLVMGVMGLVWARLSSHHFSANRLIALGSVVTALSILVVPFASGFYAFLGIKCLFAVGGAALMTLMPVLAMKSMPSGAAGSGYGRYRAYGSFGFLLGTVVIGSMSEVLDFRGIFFLASAVMLVPVYYMMAIPRCEPEQKGRQVSGRPLGIRALRLLLLVVLINGLSSPSNFTFLAVYASDLGAEKIVVGWLTGMCGIIAFLALPVMGKLADRWGAPVAVLLALACQPLRSLSYSFVGEQSSYWWLFLPQVFHFFTWAAMEVGILMLVREIVGMERYASAFSWIALMRVASMFISSPIVGYMAEHAGYPAMFRLVAAMTVLSLPVYALFLYIWKRKDAGTSVSSSDGGPGSVRAP